MTSKFAFTFEFETAPPRTVRGEVSGSSMPVCMRRAAEQAIQAAPKSDWTSCVLVLDRSGYPGVLSGGADPESEALDDPEAIASGSASEGGTGESA